MKRFACGLAVALALVSVAQAEELKSGLQPGQPIPAFIVARVAGPADGVKDGDELCYRCKYGARPQVMIFSRTTDEKLAMLAKGLDAAVAKNGDAQLKGFVNVMGASRDSAEATAKKFSTGSKLANVPVVVPVEFANGPDNYGINPKAELTVIIAKDGKVVANHAFEKDSFCESCLEKVLADVTKLVTK